MLARSLRFDCSLATMKDTLERERTAERHRNPAKREATSRRKLTNSPGVLAQCPGRKVEPEEPQSRHEKK